MHTVLHPVEGWNDAPQTIYSDHFLETQATEGPIGYKLEAPPLHSVFFPSSCPTWGNHSTIC